MLRRRLLPLRLLKASPAITISPEAERLYGVLANGDGSSPPRHQALGFLVTHHSTLLTCSAASRFGLHASSPSCYSILAANVVSNAMCTQLHAPLSPLAAPGMRSIAGCVTFSKTSGR
ncbi:hypothetical protein MRX96_023095 [Rhipicephalus microplus]